MANLLALMTLGEPGTRMIAGKRMHIATSGAWSINPPLGLVPHYIDDSSGTLRPEDIRAAMATSSPLRQPRVRVVCLENSHNNAGGEALTADPTAMAAVAARQAGAAVHLDGARLFNSAVASSVPLAELSEAADTVSVGLSKGLGAPWRALLRGPQAPATDLGATL
jgi:threonine aldolase